MEAKLPEDAVAEEDTGLQPAMPLAVGQDQGLLPAKPLQAGVNEQLDSASFLQPSGTRGVRAMSTNIGLGVDELAQPPPILQSSLNAARPDPTFSTVMGLQPGPTFSSYGPVKRFQAQQGPDVKSPDLFSGLRHGAVQEPPILRGMANIPAAWTAGGLESMPLGSFPTHTNLPMGPSRVIQAQYPLYSQNPYYQDPRQLLQTYSYPDYLGTNFRGVGLTFPPTLGSRYRTMPEHNMFYPAPYGMAPTLPDPSIASNSAGALGNAAELSTRSLVAVQERKDRPPKAASRKKSSNVPEMLRGRTTDEDERKGTDNGEAERERTEKSDNDDNNGGDYDNNGGGENDTDVADDDADQDEDDDDDNGDDDDDDDDYLAGPARKRRTTSKSKKTQVVRASTTDVKARPADKISSPSAGRGQFICPTCNAPFTTSSSLRRHRILHSGERPFKCSFANCNRTFSRKDYHVSHMRSHQGVRPFSCTFPGCSSCYADRRSLRRHLAISHEIEPEQGQISIAKKGPKPPPPKSK